MEELWFYNKKYAREVIDKIKAFDMDLDKLKSFDDLDTVTIFEYYTAWGESVDDGIANFIYNVIPEIDWDGEGEDVVRAALKDRFTECEIDSMLDHRKNGTICWFEAEISTTLDTATGEITKNYSFDADN